MKFDLRLSTKKPSIKWSNVTFIVSGILLCLGVIWFAFSPVNSPKSFANALQSQEILLKQVNRSIHKGQPARVVEIAAYLQNSANEKPELINQELIDFMLQCAVNELRKGKYSPVYRRKTLKKIQQLGVPVDLPYSNLQKVMINLKEKNFSYLGNRIWLEVKSFSYQLSFLARMGLTFVFLGIGLFLFLRLKQKRLLYSFNIGLILLLVLVWMGEENDRTSTSQQPPNIVPYNFSIDTMEEIGASRILNTRGRPLGKLIWIQENLAGFDFTAEIKDSISDSDKALLQSSAAYVNRNLEPIGFTSYQGIIQNPILQDTWDGLLIVHQNNLDVFNLAEQPTESILTNFEAYRRFRKNYVQKETGIFQLPLLVYKDSILFDAAKLSTKFRESRFFLKIRNSSGTKLLLTVDLDSYQLVGQSILSLYTKLQNSGYLVDYMLMLDVGANNYFRVYDSDGTINRRYHGMIPSNKAQYILTIAVPSGQTYSVKPKQLTYEKLTTN